jgi:hypothetical protein
VGQQVEDVRRHFKRSNWNPVGVIPGIHLHVGGTCIGCLATIRAFLDTLQNLNANEFHEFKFKKLFDRVGEVHVIAGLDVAIASKKLRGLIIIVGDCCYIKADAIPHFRHSTIERVQQLIDEEVSRLKEYKGCNPATAMTELEQFIEDVAAGREPFPH